MTSGKTGVDSRVAEADRPVRPVVTGAADRGAKGRIAVPRRVPRQTLFRAADPADCFALAEGENDLAVDERIH